MRISRERVGRTAGHAGQPPTEVEAYRLETGTGFAVTVWTYGATLVEVLVPDRAGRPANVVLRLPDLAGYEDRARNPSYLGAVLGRYARVVAGAAFRLDGVVHRLPANAGRHHIHGGDTGFDRYVWTAAATQAPDELAVTLRLRSPAGDMGYPGELTAEVAYRVRPGGRLCLDYRATTTAPTVVGLTSHAFWNLAGTGSVDGHRLTVGAARVLPTDAELVPVGPPVPVAGPLDHRAGRPLTGRLDACFALDGGRPAAQLSDPGSGRTLRIDTDQPGLAVYTGDGLPVPRAGVCLQTGGWPDAPNRPGYPSARLDPGRTYRHHTCYRLT